MNIQQTPTNQMSFKSNIRFVSSEEFGKHCLGSYFYCGGRGSELKESMKKGTDIWTSSVRSCTAGGVVDKNGAIGFHIYDIKENLNKVKDGFLNILKTAVDKPKSAIVLGSKDLKGSEESVPMFNEIEKNVKELVRPSVFKTHKNITAESDLGYEKSTDSWYIVTSHRKNPMLMTNPIEIKTAEDLKNGFEKINIAPQDKLFVRDKEVTKSDYPEFFE